MFTGIVEKIGQVERISENKFIITHDYEEGFYIGESIALSGMCSTVVEIKSNTFSVEIMEESRSKTIFGIKNIGEFFPINLERSAKMNQRNSGHFVQGHVDCLGEITKRSREGDYELFRIKYPENYRNLVISKGSIALDGISLTISALDLPKRSESYIEVSIISHTLDQTTLGQKNSGDFCHLEFDMLGKYIMRNEELGE